MKPNEIDDLLRQTFADRKVSPSEKKQVNDWLASIADDDQQLGFVRSRAFALVRELAADPSVLDWLEDFIKITVKPRGPVSRVSYDSAAFFSPGDDCIREVTRQFGLARRTCDICVFTITDDRITNAIETAQRRGVSVRVITDDEKSLDLGSDIERLKRNGIACRIDDSPAHMHHKFALFDGQRLLTGSFNWTRSATEQNEENLIVTSDARLVDAFSKRFELLWNQSHG